MQHQNVRTSQYFAKSIVYHVIKCGVDVYELIAFVCYMQNVFRVYVPECAIRGGGQREWSSQNFERVGIRCFHSPKIFNNKLYLAANNLHFPYSATWLSQVNYTVIDYMVQFVHIQRKSIEMYLAQLKSANVKSLLEKSNLDSNGLKTTVQY